MKDKIVNTINKPFEECILNEVPSMKKEGYFERDSSKKTLIVDSIQSKGTTFNTFFNEIKKFVKESYKPDDYYKILEGILKNVYFTTNSHKEYKGVCKILGESHCCLVNSKGTLTFGKKGMEGKELHFNKAIMNPPYSIGGKIWDEVRKVSDLVICLMPLAQYKEGDRIKYIASYKPVGGNGFDAIITDNLGITICKSGEYHEENTYEKFELLSYDEKFLPFYERNIERNHYAIDSYSHDSSLPKRTPSSKTDFYVTVRAAKDGVHIDDDSYDKMWNISKNISLDSMPKQTDKKSGKIKKYWGGWIQFNTETENNNYCKWYYYKGKRGLAHFLLKGMNKGGGSIKVAMPRIDWASISDHPLWKEGKYDEAVLDVMGLKWDGDKIVEV